MEFYLSKPFPIPLKKDWCVDCESLYIKSHRKRDEKSHYLRFGGKVWILTSL